MNFITCFHTDRYTISYPRFQLTQLYTYSSLNISNVSAR